MTAFAIEIVEHGWLAGADPETDLCSHGRVVVRVNGTQVITPADGEITLSAAALYLLRTLERDHGNGDAVGEHLLPCCGHVLIALRDRDEVLVVGCAMGIDWDVTHQDGKVLLSSARSVPPFASPRSIACSLPFETYQGTVVRFARTVWRLFEETTKRPSDEEERLGYAAFQREYRRRMASAGERLP